MEDKYLAYYASPGVMTAAGEYAEQLRQLPDSIEELCEAVQNLLIHIFWAERMGVSHSEARKQEVEIRSVRRMLSTMQTIHPTALNAPRAPQQRLVGNCRDFSTFMAAILRSKGIPARARCGFGTYFRPDHFVDHWVCEIWRQKARRWVLVDAQLDAFQQDVLKIDFSPLAVPRTRFILAGAAWQMCRQNQADPQRFGIFDMHGMYFIRGNVIRDLLALTKVEILPWDMVPHLEKEYELLSEDELNWLDQVAADTVAGGERIYKWLSLVEQDASLRIPADWENT